MHSGFDMSTKDKRKLKYRFENLAGIVFGARTDIEDKLKIMRVIDIKYAKEKRSDFKFLEIRYLHTESRFPVVSPRSSENRVQLTVAAAKPRFLQSADVEEAG
jgi:hypothetical protein